MMPRVTPLLLVLLLSAMAGCEQDVPQPIQWQLPLTSAPDPHRAERSGEPPSWATANDGFISLRLLSTTTTRQYPLRIPLNGEVSVQDLSIRLLGLARGLRVRSDGTLFDDPKVHNPAAFLQVRRGGALLFSGWVYQQFPEMFTPDIAGWKFFLGDATLRAPASEG